MRLKYIGYHALALSCLITSCEDDEMQDKEVPTVSITSPAADTKLWLEVTAAAEVMDDQQVSRVEFYLNDDLLGEAIEAPYELTFNSKKYEDGNYVLKTVAYDGANNQSSATREIEIFNTLLKVNIGEFYGSGFSERWVVLADGEGKVIGHEMAETDKDIHIVRPDGMDSKEFKVMIVENVTFSKNEIVRVTEYHNVLPQIWNWGTNKYQRDSLGIATIHYAFNNHDTRSFTSSFNTSGQTRTVDYVNDTTYETVSYVISANPASAYFGLLDRNDENAIPRYVLLDDLEVNAEYHLTKDDYVLMKAGQSVSLPANDSYSMALYGNLENGSRHYLYNKYNFDGSNRFTTDLPESGFKNYSYGLEIYSGLYSYHLFEEGLPRSSYVIPQFTFDINENSLESFSATIDYQADFIVNSWGFYEFDQTNHTSKTLHREVYADLKDGNVEAKAVNIPTEILEKYPLLQNHFNDLTYSSSTLNNYEEFGSLNDFIKYQFNHSEGMLHYENVKVYSNSVNARLAREQFPKHLQEEKMRRGETW